MTKPIPLMLAAAVFAAAVPAAIAFAQTPAPAAKEQRAQRHQRPMLSADARSRLLEGRLAMAKTALNLTPDQQKLWAPVEQQIRATADARTKRREEMRDRRASGEPRQRLSLPDRLERASKAMAERAQRMQAFADVVKPFYASLNDEQKAVAGVVLRQAGGGHIGHGRRWAMRRGGPGPEGVAPPAKQ